MNNEEKLQIQLFSCIKDSLPINKSLVDEISDVLSISKDSAYRRIRAEKYITLPELSILSKNYSLPLKDLVSNAQVNSVLFSTSFIGSRNLTLDKFLKGIHEELKAAFESEGSHMFFLLNELNVLQLMQIPELVAFKFYFWQKSSFGLDTFQDIPFTLDFITSDTRNLLNKIISNYVKISTTELTTTDVLNSFLKQVTYYNDAGFFSDKNDAHVLLEKLRLLVDHLLKQAEVGYKFPFGHVQHGSLGNFQLYYNDIVLVDNLILASYSDVKISFITNNSINLLKSTDENYFEYNKGLTDNLIKRSELISNTGERLRKRIHLELNKKIDDTLQVIEKS